MTTRTTTLAEAVLMLGAVRSTPTGYDCIRCGRSLGDGYVCTPGCVGHSVRMAMGEAERERELREHAAGEGE